jgi:hypothetical protein
VVWQKKKRGRQQLLANGSWQPNFEPGKFKSFPIFGFRASCDRVHGALQLSGQAAPARNPRACQVDDDAPVMKLAAKRQEGGRRWSKARYAALILVFTGATLLLVRASSAASAGVWGLRRLSLLPPGLAHLPYAEDACGRRSEAAWIMMANNERSFQHVMVSAKSLRALNTTGDIVLLSFARALPRCMLDAFSRLCVRVKEVEVPVTRDDVSNPLYRDVIDSIDKWWDFAKLLAFDLTEYSQALFVDGDTMFLRDPDQLLNQVSGHCPCFTSLFHSAVSFALSRRTTTTCKTLQVFLRLWGKSHCELTHNVQH